MHSYLEIAFLIGPLAHVALFQAVREVFDMLPSYITQRLDLKRPIYGLTSCYGHFGRELPEFTWEKTDAVADLRTALKL